MSASAARPAQEPGCPTAHQDRRPARPVGHRQALEVGDRVVLALEAERAVGPQALEHRTVLDHPAHPDPRAVHRDARPLVVGVLPAGAEADLEPTLGDEVDGRQLLGQERRVAEVAVEDEDPDVEGRGHRGDGRLHGDGAVTLVEVVGQEDRRVAELLDLPGGVGPGRAGERLVELDGEAETAGMGHDAEVWPTGRPDATGPMALGGEPRRPQDRGRGQQQRRAAMRALVYHGPGQKAWEEVPMPVIVDDTDAIVRVDAVTICGTDLHILKGDVPAVTDGRILGHEAVGTVESVGAGVKNVSRRRPGARVVHHRLRHLPLLPRGQLRPVPRRRRLDPRPQDRRHPGRVRPGPVRRHLHLPRARRASADEQHPDARRHPAHRLRGRRAQRPGAPG